MFATGLLSACAAHDRHDKLDIAVTGGQIRGVDAGDVMIWKGIPFAAPPVGELRWRPPQPVLSWQGTLDADAFKPDCAQEPFAEDMAPLRTVSDEDCLYLNLWKPAPASARPLPVLVWIYGGGFVNGGTSPAVYDGSAFAKNGIILVSFNYRLGRFGFFAHPALTGEARERGEMLGNYGYLDQIAVLKWIQGNIHAFGGDPDNVTIFGESAGATAVMHLLVSPVAAGLFHRASLLSGGGRGPAMTVRPLNAQASDGRPSAEAIGAAFAQQHGIEGEGHEALTQLRALSAHHLISGLNLATLERFDDTYIGDPIMGGVPVLDGTIVHPDPQRALESGEWAKVPVLAGSTDADYGISFAQNKDEVFAPFAAKAQQARQIYDPDDTTPLDVLRWQVAMDQLMSEPPRFVSKQVSAQGMPAYFYRFSYVAQSMRDEWAAGAPHASELPYVFNTVKARYGDDLTDADRRTAETANHYWANFAKTGNPNADGLPQWPRYDRAQDIVLDFTLDGPSAHQDLWKARLDVIETLYATDH